VRGRRGMQHLPDHQAMPPVVRVVQRQDPAEEMANESAELFRGLTRIVTAFLSGLDAAAMGLQDRLDVELLLVAEMIIDRRDVRLGAIADRPDPRAFEPLLSEFLAGRLQ